MVTYLCIFCRLHNLFCIVSLSSCKKCQFLNYNAPYNVSLRDKKNDDDIDSTRYVFVYKESLVLV